MELQENLNTPLVSIIVITYNSSKFVLETLESAKNQTYQNIELIITDDCSKDDTVSVCEKWIEKNNKRFVRTEVVTTPINTGIPGNCNRGIKKANGEWIKIIAGDDILMDNCIDQNINYIRLNASVEILFSKIRLFYTDENLNKATKGDRPVSYPPFFKEETAKGQFKTLLLGDVISFTPSSFISKNIYDKIGYYDEKFKLIEDYPFWLKATRNGIYLHYFDELTVEYRIYSESVYNSSATDKLISPVYLRNESLRTECVYPYLSKIRKARARYVFFISKVFSNRSDTLTNRLFFNLFVKYFNVLIWISFFQKKILKMKNTDYNKKLL